MTIEEILEAILPEPVGDGPVQEQEMRVDPKKLAVLLSKLLPQEATFEEIDAALKREVQTTTRPIDMYSFEARGSEFKAPSPDTAKIAPPSSCRACQAESNAGGNVSDRYHTCSRPSQDTEKKVCRCPLGSVGTSVDPATCIKCGGLVRSTLTPQPVEDKANYLDSRTPKERANHPIGVTTISSNTKDLADVFIPVYNTHQPSEKKCTERVQEANGLNTSSEEEWEKELLDLEAMNYNLYFGSLSDHKNALTNSDAEKQIIDFIKRKKAEWGNTARINGYDKGWERGRTNTLEDVKRVIEAMEDESAYIDHYGNVQGLIYREDVINKLNSLSTEEGK